MFLNALERALCKQRCLVQVHQFMSEMHRYFDDGRVLQTVATNHDVDDRGVELNGLENDACAEERVELNGHKTKPVQGRMSLEAKGLRQGLCWWFLRTIFFCLVD